MMSTPTACDCAAPDDGPWAGIHTAHCAAKHTAAAAHRRLYVEAAALVRDLEAAAASADGMALAGRFIGILKARIDPLRTAVSDVEFYEQAERIVDQLRVVGSLDGVTG